MDVSGLIGRRVALKGGAEARVVGGYVRKAFERGDITRTVMLIVEKDDGELYEMPAFFVHLLPRSKGYDALFPAEPRA